MSLHDVRHALLALTMTAACAIACFTACAPSSGNALCTCDAETEKFDGEQCVATADFTAPACESDDQPVCGCDDANYTSSCAAFTAGVEVQYGGACRTTTGGGDGFDFGW